MSSVTNSGTQRTLYQRFKKHRRRRVKRAGKWVMRRFSNFVGRQSLVPDTPVLRNEDFPILKTFEQDWETIRAEVEEILKHREAVPLFHEVSKDQKRISKGDNWRTFVLYGFGQPATKNIKQAPHTAKLLSEVPNLQSAWFSILAPGYHIPPHRGLSKGFLTCHLGLIVPTDAENCTLRVDDQVCVWREGKTFIFDDTSEHEVLNNTDEERVVLLFHVDRPMRFWGRVFAKSFLKAMKLTAYYQETTKNALSAEDRFEAAVRRAGQNLENMSEPS
ncbi:MAG: aspartyl/asparaginyl beta-hydroxylase domain-containing protein [Hyphomicrobiales bacterium]